jgi:hypothetical protein
MDIFWENILNHLINIIIEKTVKNNSLMDIFERKFHKQAMRADVQV